MTTSDEERVVPAMRAAHYDRILARLRAGEEVHGLVLAMDASGEPAIALDIPGYDGVALVQRMDVN
jgi:hypothetical protein